MQERHCSLAAVSYCSPLPICHPSRKMRGETVIVVPCYNEAARLDLAAFERFSGARPTVSLLFVDDGSTDDTPLVLERFRAQHPERVSVWRVGANVGQGGGRATRREARAASAAGDGRLLGCRSGDAARGGDAVFAPCSASGRRFRS